MAVKHFCDYCGKEMPGTGASVIIKLVLPSDHLDPCVAMAYQDVCPECVGHFTEQFKEFLDELGDNCA